MENLKEILNEAIKIRKELNLKTSDDVLWDSSVRIFNSQNANYKKSYRKSDPNELATDKQKYFLKQNKYNGDLNSLTKIEASRLIKELKEKQDYPDY